MSLHVLYIGGYGRSGSTLLDALLGSQAGIFGAGEVGTVFNRILDGQAGCSCGQRFVKCDIWAPVLDRTLASAGVTIELAAAITRESEQHYRDVKSTERYSQLWSTFLHELSSHTESRVIVDSTKTTFSTRWRPRKLHSAGLSCSIIHLVRSPDAVLSSAVAGRNRELALGVPRRRPPWIPAASWLLANLIADVQARSHSLSPSFRLEFESLLTNPEVSIRQIENAVGVDLAGLIEAIGSERGFDPGHGVAGNRMRSQGPIVLKRPNADSADESSRSSSKVVGPLLSAIARQLRWHG